ncbi:hypothetical protein HYZ97_02410 [Candidatus Pacearchaeota archaeon]|nr:hypothetical protein [Candidatus Pacearchaeota archaeon]
MADFYTNSLMLHSLMFDQDGRTHSAELDVEAWQLAAYFRGRADQDARCPGRETVLNAGEPLLLHPVTILEVLDNLDKAEAQNTLLRKLLQEFITANPQMSMYLDATGNFCSKESVRKEQEGIIRLTRWLISLDYPDAYKRLMTLASHAADPSSSALELGYQFGLNHPIPLAIGSKETDNENIET